MMEQAEAVECKVQLADKIKSSLLSYREGSLGD
jgi:hypothetical protein